MASIHSDLTQLNASRSPRPDAIDDVGIERWLEPDSADEVARLLADAAGRGQAIAPVGGGTKLAIGNAPARIDAALSTAKLNRVLHYEPTDMTLSVEAGIRFADLQRVLAEKGQTLPIEVPDAEDATIGGLIATAIAGPRRYGSGTLRDLLIGITCAYPSGIVAKAGGLVVKNVTGFDLMRLHLGALGTLGVIVSANFKVLPLARTEATLITDPGTLTRALAAADASKSGRVRPVAIEVFAADGAWRAAVRIEGRPETVNHGVASLEVQGVWPQHLQGEESAHWWRGYVERQSLLTGSEIAIRCGAEPKAGAALAETIARILDRHDISPELMAVSPRLGTVHLGMAGIEPDSFPRLHSALADAASAVTVLRAPAQLKSQLDVWGKTPKTVDVMRALKSEFDPHNVLNPGRFVDRL
jgi:glycolate oxidase FAD binding subunit